RTEQRVAGSKKIVAAETDQCASGKGMASAQAKNRGTQGAGGARSLPNPGTGKLLRTVVDTGLAKGGSGLRRGSKEIGLHPIVPLQLRFFLQIALPRRPSAGFAASKLMTGGSADAELANITSSSDFATETMCRSIARAAASASDSSKAWRIAMCS